MRKHDLLHKSHFARKPVLGVSDQFGCTATEGGKGLKISDSGSRGIVRSICLCSEDKCADQLCG